MSKAELKKIEILRDTVADKEVARKGSIVAIEKSDANYLIVTGYAKEAHPKAMLKRVSKEEAAKEAAKTEEK